ncbi:MAG: Eco57I restriction-modification methylase domain-containing protein [Candidatus Hodarchaeota archaeon]
MSNYTEFNGKELGLVLTPPKTANYMISKLGIIKTSQKILDPCVGPGVFIKVLLNLGVNQNQIWAYEINPNYKADIESLGVHFEVRDTLLTIDPNSFNEFDFIIGNPPYLNKASSYVRKNKSRLKELYGDVNAHETYSMFIVNSIWRLKEGGKLGFITSDSFLTLSTHKKLRNFILENCLIDEILLPPRDLFSKQGVSTSPAIIILTKCTGEKNKGYRDKYIMRIVSRLENEEQYNKLKYINNIRQKKYHSLPFNIFFIDVEPEIIDLFENSPKLEDYLKGYIGMHTHDNRKYIAAVDGTSLANIFKKRNSKNLDPDKKFKIISKEELNSETWKPYLKRGGADQYYRPIMEGLIWDKNSIPIYDIPKNVPFEQEGIVISGVSSRLAARYMPEGCYWDSNKAIGFILKNKTITIHYILGLLNSSLYNYLAKGIINNTSSIQITGIHSLPIIPPNNNTKEQVESHVGIIIRNKRKNLNYNYKSQQKEIDNLIFNFYSQKFNFPEALKVKLDQKYSIY